MAFALLFVNSDLTSKISVYPVGPSDGEVPPWHKYECQLSLTLQSSLDISWIPFSDPCLDYILRVTYDSILDNKWDRKCGRIFTIKIPKMADWETTNKNDHLGKWQVAKKVLRKVHDFPSNKWHNQHIFKPSWWSF